MSPEGEFQFVGLPPRKAIVRTGYCEPPEGDIYNSVVVNIDDECIKCATEECHMFAVIRGKAKDIIGRAYKHHDPQY